MGGALETATGRSDLRHLTLLPAQFCVATANIPALQGVVSGMFGTLAVNGVGRLRAARVDLRTIVLLRGAQIPPSHHLSSLPLAIWPSRRLFTNRLLSPLRRLAGAGHRRRKTSQENRLPVSNNYGRVNRLGSCWPCYPTLPRRLPADTFAGTWLFTLRRLSVGMSRPWPNTFIARAASCRIGWMAEQCQALESLLRIARALNVSAAGFFFRKAPIASDVATAKQSVAALGNRSVSPSRTASEIRKVLRRAIKMESPISLSERCAHLGYKTTERLYQADRKVCHRIAARYRKSGRSHWWRKPGATRICEGPKLKQILEEAAKSNEPVSVHQIAARLGYSNDGYIGQKYPELCAAIGRKIAERKQASLGEMRRTLERSLEENPAPTLAELSQRLGCSTSTTLRTHEPELCDRILARYRTCIEERRCALRTAAELSLNEAPAPSLRSVCERLGISAWFMNNYFPDVQRRIVERHRRWKTAETVRRRERLVDIVHGIAKEVQSQGLYPSATRIADRIPQGYRCEWMTLNAAVRQAQRALGISITAS